jgi:hypothetical protein
MRPVDSAALIISAALAAFAAPARADLIVPAYSSRPAASVKLFLDFDGDFTAEWGQLSGNIDAPRYHPGATPAYDLDGDTASFSAAELEMIQKVWARVAEKYSPFNLDVTTVDPGNINNLQTLKAVIGGSGAWLGQSAGGVANVDSFSSTDPKLGDNIVFVFPAGSSDDRLLGENTAHELGHGLGLEHQSTYSGTTKIEEYNTNGDSALTAPIMGLSRNANRGLWWNGPSSVRNPFNGNLPVPQDDLAVITKSINGITYRADDHGSTAATATVLTPQADRIAAAGVIEQTTDVDCFRFDTPGGDARFTLSPPLGGMLDAKLELFDDVGALVQAADHLAGSTSESLSESLAAALSEGWYTLAVSSHGSYGDIGEYSITGTTAPEPAAGLIMIGLMGGMSLRRRRLEVGVRGGAGE